MQIGRGQKFECKKINSRWEGDKISVHRHFKALLTHLENILNISSFASFSSSFIYFFFGGGRSTKIYVNGLQSCFFFLGGGV